MWSTIIVIRTNSDNSKLRKDNDAETVYDSGQLAPPEISTNIFIRIITSESTQLH
jgi:hypothetical protein